MDEKEFECCEQCYEDVVTIPIEEFKKLVRCEQSLKVIFSVDSNRKYSSDTSDIVTLLAKMHPDLLPEKKEVKENAE